MFHENPVCLWFPFTAATHGTVDICGNVDVGCIQITGCCMIFSLNKSFTDGLCSCKWFLSLNNSMINSEVIGTILGTAFFWDYGFFSTKFLWQFSFLTAQVSPFYTHSIICKSFSLHSSLIFLFFFSNQLCNGLKRYRGKTLFK